MIMATTSEERDWTSLPNDIVISISERLPITDYFRFCSVCTSWSSLSAENFPIPSRFPSLLTCRRSSKKTAELSKFSIQTFPEHRNYRLPKIPERVNYLGYHDGWLIVAHGSGHDVEAYLLNPITRVQVPLPSCKNLCKGLPYCRIGKIVLSNSPSSPEGFVALASFGSFNSYLAYCKAGDKTWTLLKSHYTSEHKIDDIVFHDGKFFVISNLGQLETFDLSGFSPKPSTVVASNLDFGARKPAWVAEFTDDVHLVSSCSGDLLQVRGKRAPQSGEMLKFTVYKFGSDSHWVEIKDLGCQSLFVGSKHSMCLPSLGRQKGNCIYFTEFESWDCQSGDARVFEMAKGVVTPFATPGSLVGRMPLNSLFWFIPSLA